MLDQILTKCIGVVNTYRSVQKKNCHAHNANPKKVYAHFNSHKPPKPVTPKSQAAKTCDAHNLKLDKKF